MTFRVYFLLMTLLITFGFTSANAQGKEESIKALNLFEEKLKLNYFATDPLSFRGASVAVEPDALTIKVFVAVGASLDVTSLESISVIAQPVFVSKDSVQDVGKPAKIQTGKIERNQGNIGSVIFTPQMIIANLKDANALKVSIVGIEAEGSYTMIVSTDSGIKTAAVGRVVAASAR